jgi:hypothetical protein
MPRKHQKPLRAKLQPDDPFFQIISDAYAVFDYAKPSSMDVCQNCCMDADIEADFFSAPIAELPLHYLQDWFFAAYDPNGISKGTWAYLLPRILEVLAADEEAASVGLEVSLNRFATGNPNNWYAEEWRVLDRFQRAYLEREISRDTGYLDDTLCMFALAGWNLDSLFAQVAASPDTKLVERLWNDWCRNCIPGRESVWITAFWESPGNSKAFEFYTSKLLYDRFTELALDDRTEKRLAEKAFAVASVIEQNGYWNAME